jgi:aryl-alcohol dehydrogenase-like predicted oxidoreductase
MRYRTIGGGALTLSEIALGTGDTAGGIIYGAPAEQRRLVERALELGVTLFDCSPDYGKGLGEANLGRVLREL